MSAAEQDIVFLDTETLGLDPAAPIWEFAAVRRSQGPLGTGEWTSHLTIQHEPGHYADELPKHLRADYDTRYVHEEAWCPAAAASQIAAFTSEARIVGCNPCYDLERLTTLLQRHGHTPAWHYHPDDITSINVGYLAALGKLPPRPWTSNTLSIEVGVSPECYARHTALGDVQWVMAQWDKVMQPVGTLVRGGHPVHLTEEAVSLRGAAGLLNDIAARLGGEA